MTLHGQSSSSNNPNSRSSQHSTPLPTNQSLPPLTPSRRLVDALHTIQEEYNRLLSERDSLRHELARTQNLASEQDMELNMIRRAIWNLQNQLESHRQRFEEERQKLFDELRQQRAAAGLAPPSPLRDLPNSPPLSASTSSPSVIQIPEDRNRELSYDRKMKGRARDYSELESGDYREPKRMRSIGDGNRAHSLPKRSPVPPTHQSHHQLPPTSNTDPVVCGEVNGVAAQCQPPTPPPPQTTKTAAPPNSEDLNLANVSPEYRKELNDWAVIFNPKLPRNVDIDLIQSIPHPSVVCSIHFSPDGQYVATGCNQAVYIYDIKTGAQICSLIDPALPRDGDLYIRSVRFSPDGEYLATGAEDQQVRIWNVKTRTLRYVFAGHSNEIYALDYSQNGRYIVSGSADRTARVWDVKRGQHKVFQVDSAVEEAGITSISISPDNEFVAGGCLDHFIRIWNIRSGEMVAKLRGHSDSVYAVRFMPDGQRLVSGSLDCTVKYWDVSSLASFRRQSTLVSCPLVNSVKGHQDYVLTVACSDDNRWVVSGAKDRGMVLWDPLEGNARFKLNGHTNSVISADIHGPYIATASGDMCCRIWGFSESSPSKSD